MPRGSASRSTGSSTGSGGSRRWRMSSGIFIAAISRDRWAGRSGKLTTGQRELEAEAVSWLVCRRLGLETRSAEYLAGYVDKDDLGRISTFAITAAAHRVEAWRRAE